MYILILIIRLTFFRLLPGNIREVSALKNTLEETGITDTTFIADKGFYSENNINAKKIKVLNTSFRQGVTTNK